MTPQAVRCQLLAVSRSSRHPSALWKWCRRKPSPACRQRQKIPIITSTDFMLQSPLGECSVCVEGCYRDGPLQCRARYAHKPFQRNPNRKPRRRRYRTRLCQGPISATNCSPVAVILGRASHLPVTESNRSSDHREDGVPRVLRVRERASE